MGMDLKPEVVSAFNVKLVQAIRISNGKKLFFIFAPYDSSIFSLFIIAPGLAVLRNFVEQMAAKS